MGVTPERAMDELGQDRFDFGNPLSELFAKPSSYEQLWDEVSKGVSELHSLLVTRS